MHVTVLLLCICPAPIDGLSLLNEDGDFSVFFPRNSFVTNTMLTHTNTPRKEHKTNMVGNDHIVCYGGSTQAAQVTWHNSDGGQLAVCITNTGPAPCRDCGARCLGNGGVGVDPLLNGSTDIHMYTNSPSYVNQDLECRVSSGPSAFIGVYLMNGGEFVVAHYNTIIQHFGPCTSHIADDICNYITVELLLWLAKAPVM